MVNPVVKIWSPLTIGLVVGIVGVLAAAGIAIYLRRRRVKDPVELERMRRQSLGRTGRITSGEVTGLIEPEGANTALLLVYRYDISGVTYEVMQDISTMPAVATIAHRLIGKGISVKYEMKRPTNSIVVCEQWSGLRGISLQVPEEGSALPSPATANKS
jgi:hypothetical protein